MDKNKDGSISREEAKGTPFEKDFSKLDKDGDGKLSASEQAEAKSGAGATGESKAPKNRKARRVSAVPSACKKPRFGGASFSPDFGGHVHDQITAFDCSSRLSFLRVR